MMKFRPKTISIGVLAFLTTISLATAAMRPRVWTAEDKETWKRAVKRVVTTPPCCGACSIVSMDEGRKAYRYITGEDTSPEAEKIYNEHEKKLLEAFRYFNPSRYDVLFGNSANGDTKQ